MRRIAFDFDNTLVDCISSDYEIYLSVCKEMVLIGLDFLRYEQLRRAGRFNQILEETCVEDETAFRKIRNRIALDENFCLRDRPILNIELLEKLPVCNSFAIISSRNSDEILDEQIRRLGWQGYFERYCVPRGSDEEVAEAKKVRLIEFGATYFVGDRLSDLRAAQAARVKPILVKTGFRFLTEKNVSIVENVNDFLRTLC